MLPYWMRLRLHETTRYVNQHGVSISRHFTFATSVRNSLVCLLSVTFRARRKNLKSGYKPVHFAPLTDSLIVSFSSFKILILNANIHGKHKPALRARKVTRTFWETGPSIKYLPSYNTELSSTVEPCSTLYLIRTDTQILVYV